MQRIDFQRFTQALTACAELYGRELSEGALQMWWRLLDRYDIEQVESALHACVSNADSGQFMPKPADVIRVLAGGTHTDRAQIAWGKVLKAMSTVGAYADVVFDDPSIHAVIEDLGGWPKLCRTETKELGFVQNRFCLSHKAYTGKGQIDYPRILGGDRSPDSAYAEKGLAVPKPALIGNEQKAVEVMSGGSASGRTEITFGSRLLGIAANVANLVRTARMQCKCCNTAREFPGYRLFDPACLHCGARYIQAIGACAIAKSEAQKWKTKVLNDWLRHGHPETALRALAASMAPSLTPVGTGESEPPSKGKQRSAGRK